MSRLAVEVTGAGEPLVLLHGWGMHGGIWNGVRTELAKHFQILQVDLPGHGASPNCEPYTLDEIVNTLTAAMPDEVHLCGWSLGGLVALAWARQAPAQIKRLILVSSTPRFTSSGPEWKSGIAGEVLQSFARGLEEDYEGTLKRFLSLQARNGEDARAVMTELRASLFSRGHPDPAALRAGLRILLETDLRSQTPEIRQSALLIHGDRDTLVPIGAGEWLAAHLTDARLTRVAGAAHAPFLSHPGEFARLVRRFLGTDGSGQGNEEG